MQTTNYYAIGYALDFNAPTASSTLRIYAPANGTITKGCSVGNGTFLYFKSDRGDSFRVKLNISSESL